MLRGTIVYLALFSSLIVLVPPAQGASLLPECKDVRWGQFTCDEPRWDTTKNAARDCRANGTVTVVCHAEESVECWGTRSWHKDVACVHVGSKRWLTALGLSVFLGCCGIDRCYLGYPACGLFKFATFGFFVFGSLLDAALVALQVVQPADGSGYVIDTNMPRMHMQKPGPNTYDAHPPPTSGGVAPPPVPPEGDIPPPL